MSVVDVMDNAASTVGVVPDSTEARVLDAVVACASRWGIDKTTVDDVAREAGVSRATVYRLFPGGKAAMVQLTTDREVVAMLIDLLRRIERAQTLTDAVVELLHGGTMCVAGQPAIAYMRNHEPASLRSFFSFRRLDSLFVLSAEVLAPALYRFLPRDEASACVIWAARLVVSHFLNPDPVRDLEDEGFARRIAENHIVVGLGAGSATLPDRSLRSTESDQEPTPTPQEA